MKTARSVGIVALAFCFVGGAMVSGVTTRNTSLTDFDDEAMQYPLRPFCPSDRVVTFDYNGDGNRDLFLYRPGYGAAWVARSNGDGTFSGVYTQGHLGFGIAGFDLKVKSDRALAFDYNGDGKDDLFLYRPGQPVVWVARSNGDGTFTKVYGGYGIAGHAMSSVDDRVLAFDYNGDGKDDLFIYAPGTGSAWVARSNGDGTFTAVYKQGYGGSGIAGHILQDGRDRVLIFDYNADNKDDLFIYTPGTGSAWVAHSNGDGTFSAVYREGYGGRGFAGHGLVDERDRAFAFDYNGDRKDDIFIYTPGAGCAWVARSKGNGTFTPVYAEGYGGHGFAGHGLVDERDRALAFDYNGDGKDDIFIYTPGAGCAWVARSNGDGTFTPVYAEGYGGKGIAGHILSNEWDRVLPFDYNGGGTKTLPGSPLFHPTEDLFICTPDLGAAWVARSNANGTFTAVYAEGYYGKGIAGYDLYGGFHNWAQRYGLQFNNSFTVSARIFGHNFDSWPMGFCGGMCATVLNRFNAGLPIPATTTTPTQNTPLYHELLDRQTRSLSLGIVATMLQWQSSPDEDHWLSLTSVGQRTKNAWPALQARLDSGVPTILILIRVESKLPSTIGGNHQVIALAYKYNNSTKDLTIYVYDPNDENEIRELQMNFGLSNNKINCQYTGSGGRVRGFFVNPDGDSASL